jgi:hypothetical protein
MLEMTEAKFGEEVLHTQISGKTETRARQKPQRESQMVPVLWIFILTSASRVLVVQAALPDAV